MPVYVFKCPVCEKVNEILLSVDEITEAKPKCPVCSSLMKRVFTTFAIHGFEYPNSVNYYEGEDNYGEQEQKKEIAMVMKKLEQDGRINELSRDDQKFYEGYCKT
jgi:putative FmdB family regulatory protein